MSVALVRIRPSKRKNGGMSPQGVSHFRKATSRAAVGGVSWSEHSNRSRMRQTTRSIPPAYLSTQYCSVPVCMFSVISRLSQPRWGSDNRPLERLFSGPIARFSSLGRRLSSFSGIYFYFSCRGMVMCSLLLFRTPFWKVS